MAVRRKPTVDEFINAGESPAAAKSPTATSEQQQQQEQEQEQETIALTLRVPRDLLQEIDAAAKQCRPRRSRNVWIQEAIVAKLDLDRA